MAVKIDKDKLAGIVGGLKSAGKVALNAKNTGLTQDKIQNAGLTTDEAKALVNALPSYDTAKETAAKNAAWDAYKNREKFSYDLNADAFYNMYKDKYVAAGKQAMTDTVGQAAALTGGYGNTYGQVAGQQAYNQYMQQLNDIAPQLYQAAYDRYNAEGDRLLDIYNAEAAAEAEKYGRYADEYNRQAGLQGSAAEKLKWLEEYEYQKQQDAQTQANYEAEIAYQKQQDAQTQANADREYQMQTAEFEYNKKQNERNYAYDAATTAVQYGNVPDAATIKATGLSKSYWSTLASGAKTKEEKELAASGLDYVITSGGTPTAEMFEAAGFDKATAKSMANSAKSASSKEDKKTAYEACWDLIRVGVAPSEKQCKAAGINYDKAKAAAKVYKDASSSKGGGTGKSSTGTGTSGKSGTGSSSTTGKSSSSSTGYDNGKLSTEQVKQMQNYYGLDADGKWGPNSQSVTGMSADKAWAKMNNSVRVQENKESTYKQSSKDASAEALTKEEFARRKAANGGKYIAYGVENITYRDYLETMASTYIKTDGWTETEAESWVNEMLK